VLIDDMQEELVLNKPNDQLKKLFRQVLLAEGMVEMVENDEFHNEMDLLNAKIELIINKRNKSKGIHQEQ
jgi:hypothetical protein